MAERPEELRIIVMRKRDVNEWRAEMEKGNGTARLVLLAASRCSISMDTEYLACSCCDRPFLAGELPAGYIVIAPAEENPEVDTAVASVVCAECSAHDDKWVVVQSVHCKGPFARAVAFR